MIINPIVAAAAVAARAVGTIFPGDNWTVRRQNNKYRQEPSFRHEAYPGNQYFDGMEEHAHHGQATYIRDMEDNAYGQTAYNQDIDTMNEQERELKDFMATPEVIVQDAEILSKEQEPTQKKESSSTNNKHPPPLPNINNPLILLGLNPGANFDDIRRAYRQMAKLYHPDVVMGPDATADERKDANWDFARINAAFEILKRKENEEVFEYSVYEDGQQVTRSVVVSEDSRQNDPHRINNDRLVEMTEYRKRHPQQRQCYEDDNDHGYRQRRNDSFDGGGSGGYTVNAYSPGKRWIAKGLDRRDVSYTPDGFGHISSNEKMWEERLTVEQEGASSSSSSPSSHVGSRNRSGFGAVNPQQWWNRGSDFGYEAPHNGHTNYQPGNNNNERLYMAQGYPYKEMRNERTTFDETGHNQPTHNTAADYEYDPQERFPMQEKWWKMDDSAMGDFAP